MRHIVALSRKHWPIFLSISTKATVSGGAFFFTGLSSSKWVLVLELYHNYRRWLPTFYAMWMISFKGSEMLQAGYINAPFFPLVVTQPVMPRWSDKVSRWIRGVKV